MSSSMARASGVATTEVARRLLRYTRSRSSERLGSSAGSVPSASYLALGDAPNVLTTLEQALVNLVRRIVREEIAVAAPTKVELVTYRRSRQLGAFRFRRSGPPSETVA